MSAYEFMGKRICEISTKNDLFEGFMWARSIHF